MQSNSEKLTNEGTKYLGWFFNLKKICNLQRLDGLRTDETENSKEKEIDFSDWRNSCQLWSALFSVQKMGDGIFSLVVKFSKGVTNAHY